MPRPACQEFLKHSKMTQKCHMRDALIAADVHDPPTLVSVLCKQSAPFLANQKGSSTAEVGSGLGCRSVLQDPYFAPGIASEPPDVKVTTVNLPRA